MVSGDALEVEIRAGSIQAIEELRQGLRDTHQLARSAVLLDFFLWDYAKLHGAAMAHIPIHHVRSIYY